MSAPNNCVQNTNLKIPKLSKAEFSETYELRKKVADQPKLVSTNWFKTSVRRLNSFEKSPKKVFDKTTRNYDCLQQIKGNQIVQKGYLNIKSRNKNRKRYWCVLSIDQLKLFEKPHSFAPSESLSLKDYKCSFENANSQNAFISMESKKNIKFLLSSDQPDNIAKWFDSIKKSTLSVSQLISNGHGQSQKAHNTNHSRLNNVEIQKNSKVDCLAADLQKQKLLQVIKADKQKLFNELNSLQVESSSSLSTKHHKMVLNLHKDCSNDDDNLLTRNLAMLNRRRNSQQLKIAQVSRDLNTKKQQNSFKRKHSKKKLRRTDFVKEKTPLVSKLLEMKKRMAKIDEELKELQTQKKSFLEKIDIKTNEGASSVKPINQNIKKNILRESVSIPLSFNKSYSNLIKDGTLESQPEFVHQNLTKTKSSEPFKSKQCLSFTSSDTSKVKSTDKLPKVNVDPEVLASIQMFEEFSKITLAKMNSQKMSKQDE